MTSSTNLGWFFAQLIEQPLYFLPTQQFMRMPLDEFRESGSQWRIPGSTTVYPAICACSRCCSGTQMRRKAEGRLLGRQPMDSSLAEPYQDRSPAHAPASPPTCEFHAFEQRRIFVGPKLQVVANMDRRQDKAHLFGELSPEPLDPVQQGATLPSVHQADETVSDLHFHEIQGDHLGAGLLGLDLRRGRCRNGFRGFLLLIDLIGDPRAQAPQRQKRHMGKAQGPGPG
jgi:hypothetical protein